MKIKNIKIKNITAALLTVCLMACCLFGCGSGMDKADSSGADSSAGDVFIDSYEQDQESYYVAGLDGITKSEDGSRRKFIIDAGVGADGALAIAMMAKADNIELMGVTCVEGNSTIENEARAALMTLEMCGVTDVPVYLGEYLPDHDLRDNIVSVFGQDGMGDQDLIHPTQDFADGDAAQFIVDTVNANPGEVEIMMIGPATDIAVALDIDPDLLDKVRMLWIMGTTGYGQGNATPVAEFNVYNDVTSFARVLDEAPNTIIVPFALSHEVGYFNGAELDEMIAEGGLAEFIARSFAGLRSYNADNYGGEYVDMCDAVLAAVAIDEDLVLDSENVAAVCVTDEGLCYGSVIYYEEEYVYETMPNIGEYNDRLIMKMDKQAFRQLIEKTFEQGGQD